MTDIEDIIDINKSTRIAVIDPDRCKPNKCGKPCIKSCPVVRQGKMCIQIDKMVNPDHPDKLRDIARIAEALCTGCGICVKACPYDAIKVVRVPRNLETEVSHRFGPNSFKLHRFPEIKPRKVYGIIGQNGLGKSTILQILSGHLQMNLGKFGDDTPSSKDILTHFRGSSMQNFFKHDDKRIAYKQQHLKRALAGTDLKTSVRDHLLGGTRKSDAGDDAGDEDSNTILDSLGLQGLLERPLGVLSGGELQRVLCAKVCLETEADLYLFDEPTSYLDLKQRLRVSDAIRRISGSISKEKAYTVVVDHDLSILDYMSDFVIALYGKPGVYGVSSAIYPVAVGINAYLNGYLPKENMRFRRTPYTFERNDVSDDQVIPDAEEDGKGGEILPPSGWAYPAREWSVGDFHLTIEKGWFPKPGITILMGENGTGKTSFANLLASSEDISISYKEQDLSSKMRSKRFASQTVTLALGGPTITHNGPFLMEVLRPLGLEVLFDRTLSDLSGGELQKVMIARCLAQNHEVYLLDEPSAYLDLETRVCLAKLLRRWFINHDKIACIIDHDIVFCTYLADQLVLFEGEPGVKTVARSPCGVEEGMNRYLHNLGITIRSDKKTHRRRINKAASNKDREQKASGIYYAI